MARPRMAFAAEFWDDRAVVCRAMENATGCAVVQEFGLFDSWTEANFFAAKLNEGLGLSADEARVVVTDALLASAELLKVAAHAAPCPTLSPVLARAHFAQMEFLRCSLLLARTFCHLARCQKVEEQSARLFQNAWSAAEQAVAYLIELPMTRAEAENILVQIEVLKGDLRLCHATA